MNYKMKFIELMNSQGEIALATSNQDRPNVRIMNFIYEDGKIYLASFNDNQKVKDFEVNPNVALTTIPKSGENHVRVVEGIIKKSDKTITQMADRFVEKFPGYQDIIDYGHDMLSVYEIAFSEATIILDYQHIEQIAL